MRKKIVAGNWKMHGTKDQSRVLTSSILQELSDVEGVDVVVFPPFVYLDEVSKLAKETNLTLGAQNVYPASQGALTGEISPTMLLEFDCRYVLVGHSERRHLLKEDENFVTQKYHHVKEHGMIPMLCVGETLQEREKNQTFDVIAQQLLAVTKDDRDAFSQCVIAYEPVWAIGTGKTATPEQAQEMHAFIREVVDKQSSTHAEKLPILYGGSVNETNARTLFEMPDVDGGLVGGASLNAKQFLEIVKCIN